MTLNVELVGENIGWKALEKLKKEDTRKIKMLTS